MAPNRIRKIIVARSAGFCFGVKRAIRLAFETSGKKDGEEIYTLGPIIHNPQIVEKLEKEGVAMINDVGDIECGTLIIRSHGMTREEKEELDVRDLALVDATCPFVKKAREFASRLADEGYTLLILGDRDHPEVRSILSYVKGRTEVITDENEILKAKNRAKAGIVAQTTQTKENLLRWVEKALDIFQEIRVYNTICNATTVRQEETVEIARAVDGIVVIGGYNSANTGRLAKLASQYNDKVFHIEKAEELLDGHMEGISTLGISAGASTPHSAIEHLIEYVRDTWGAEGVETVQGM